MKYTLLVSLLTGQLLLGCSSDEKTGFPDGASDCAAGSKIAFDPPLAGEDTDYTIIVDSDFGDVGADFEAPISCDVTTGSVPEEDRTARCSSVSDEVYNDGEGDSPPQLWFDGPAEKVKGVVWGHETDSASVTVKKGEEIVFQGDVTLSSKTCNDGFDDITYQGATVDLSGSAGGAGGQPN